MSEWISRAGTTGPSVVYNEQYDVVRVYASGELVYSIRGELVSISVGVSDIDDLFNWVYENYSSEIAECMDALGI